MKCPKCNSENVQMQSKEHKLKLTVPIFMVGGGFGLFFGGFMGGFIGIIISAVVAGIVYTIAPTTYQSVPVCQECGFTSTNVPAAAPVDLNTLFCTADECNLIVSRKASNTGSVCTLRVRIDTCATFDLINGDRKFLRLEPGTHRITYYQVNGMGKQKRSGALNVVIGEEKRLVRFDFLLNGIDVFTQ